MDYDDEYETVFPLPFWALLLLVVIVCIPGCATTKEADPQVCFLQPLGRTESGLSVVKSLCMTEEQFAETQK
jgi:hypothetical protein